MIVGQHHALRIDEEPGAKSLRSRLGTFYLVLKVLEETPEIFGNPRKFGPAAGSWLLTERVASLDADHGGQHFLDDVAK
jgi:hypothetical protein